MTYAFLRVLPSLSRGEVGRLTVEVTEGARKPPEPPLGTDPVPISILQPILGLLGGWMVGVRLGGDISGVSVSGMLALECPGSEILRENLSSRPSLERQPLGPSLSMLRPWRTGDRSLG